MKRILAFALISTAVFAQGNAPFVPPPANSTTPASAYDNLPSKPSATALSAPRSICRYRSAFTAPRASTMPA